MLSRMILVLLAILCLQSCSDQSGQPSVVAQHGGDALRVGTNVWPGYEPLYLARHLGEWSEAEIRLVEFPSASEVLRAFRNKSIEAASLTLDEVLMLRQKNVPVTVVLIHDFSAGADVIMAKPDIASLRDLRGRRIGVESGALGALVLTRALEINGMSLNDVNVVDIGVDIHLDAYNRNEVDAVVTFEPVRTQLLAKGSKEIFSSKEMPGEIVDVLVVHRDVLESNAQGVQKLVDGWFNALAYQQANAQQAAQIIAKRLKITAQEVIDSYQGIVMPDVMQNRAFLGGEAAEIEKTIKLLNRVMVGHRLLSAEVVADDLFTSAFLGNAK